MRLSVLVHLIHSGCLRGAITTAKDFLDKNKRIWNMKPLP